MDSFQPRNCLECGKPLHGRVDKRFCDAYCRNTYNNRHKADDELLIQEINRHIRRNRRILKTLCPEGKAIIRRDLLEASGYNFAHFTGTYQNPDGQIYYLCYDYGFAAIIEQTRYETKQKALIIQRQNYMDKPFDPWRK